MGKKSQSSLQAKKKTIFYSGILKKKQLYKKNKSYQSV